MRPEAEIIAKLRDTEIASRNKQIHAIEYDVCLHWIDCLKWVLDEKIASYHIPPLFSKRGEDEPRTK